MHATASNSARASLWEWALTTLLGANLGWTTLCLGGYRPETMVVSSALTGVLLVAHFTARAVDKSAPAVHPASGWLLPFLIYAAANVLAVSPVPWLGWLDWLGWANMLAVFWVGLNGIRSVGPRRTLFGILVLLGIVAVAMGCYQRFVQPGWLMLGRHQVEQFFGRASGPFGIPNSLAAFLLLLLPAAGALVFRRRASAVERVWWGWTTLVFALGVLLTLSRGAWLGIAIALVAWPLATTRWHWKRRAGFAAAVIGAWVVVGAVAYGASPKVRERFGRLVHDSGELSRPILWRGAWNLFREYPVTGTGAGSYNVLFERHRPERFHDEPQWAHNDYLNTLSDYGLIGFGLFFGVSGVLAVRYWRRAGQRDGWQGDWLDSPATTAGLGIGLLAFAFQLFVDFHFKIPALALACAVTSALALGGRSALPATHELVQRSRASRYACVAAAGAVAIAIIPIVRLYRAEALRHDARQSINDCIGQRREHAPVVLQEAEAVLRRAVALHAGNASAWSDLAFAFEMQALVTPARAREMAESAEQAARRALLISSVVPEFWIRLGVALDMQRRFPEALVAFQQCLNLAPRNSHAWYYYAYHLSLDTNGREAALLAIAISLSLDPGNRTAEALRAKLNERL